MIYLVRHAHSDWSPDEQRPLSAKGQTDAERLADVLIPYSIKAIYSSPFRRARQTVEPLAARLGLTIIEHPDLRERKLSAEPIEDFLATVTMLWENPNLSLHGGESNVEAQTRGVATFKELSEKHPNPWIVLATHGNLLALILQHLGAPVDSAFWQSMTMPDVYGLKLSPKGNHLIARFWEDKS